MKARIIATCVCAYYLTAHSTAAIESGMVQLRSKNKIERTQTTYDCGSAGQLAVTYINADPNFLAILPVPKQAQPIVFTSVIAGSGARYSAGKYVWWTKGNSASLYDVTLGDNAPPILTCNAAN